MMCEIPTIKTGWVVELRNTVNGVIWLAIKRDAMGRVVHSSQHISKRQAQKHVRHMVDGYTACAVCHGII